VHDVFAPARAEQDLFAPARAELDRLPGVAGVLVRDAKGHDLFTYGDDDVFPAASVIKVPLVMALYADAAEGRIDLEERVPVGAKVGGTGMLGDLADTSDVSLRDLAMLTIALSDNIATNRLIERIGIPRIAERLTEWGCAHTKLQQLMFDEEAKRRGLDNVATPSEMVALLERLLRGECVDRATSDAVLAILRRCQDDAMLRRYLPRGGQVANKTGTLEATRNDAAIIWGPERTVVAAAFIRELRDWLAGVHALGIVGWCAGRAAGLAVPALPFPIPALPFTGAAGA